MSLSCVSEASVCLYLVSQGHRYVSILCLRGIGTSLSCVSIHACMHTYIHTYVYIQTYIRCLPERRLYSILSHAPLNALTHAPFNALTHERLLYSILSHALAPSLSHALLHTQGESGEATREATRLSLPMHQLLNPEVPNSSDEAEETSSKRLSAVADLLNPAPVEGTGSNTVVVIKPVFDTAAC